MARFSIFLLLGALLGVRFASAQECNAGPADTVPNAGDALEGMPLYWTVPQVRAALREVLNDLKYKIITPASDSGAVETKPSFRLPGFPDAGTMAQRFGRYKQPGIVVRAFARAEGDSARLFLLAKALCHVADAPPDGSTIPVESSLELFAAQEIAFGVVDRLRRDHPRHF